MELPSSSALDSPSVMSKFATPTPVIDSDRSHVIDVYLTNARSSAWVFDTGSVAHICNSNQGLWIKRRLAKDEVTIDVYYATLFL